MKHPQFKLRPLATLFVLMPLTGVTLAQETAPADDLAIENITVTAQRTAQSIQSTPVSMTALTASDVERMQIDNAKDLSQVAPNVNIRGITGGSAGIAPYIRGGGVTDGANITSENEVGIYIDNIYQPRSAASFIEMLDIERVEVLRGPQGTLYGRNSSAGALKFISRAPDELFRFKNEAGIGRWNEKYDKLIVSGGLNESGTLRGGFSGMYRDRDGGRQYAETLQKEVGAEEFKGFQGDLYYVGDDFSARLKAFYTDFESDGMYASAVDMSSMDKPSDKWEYSSGSLDRVVSPKESFTRDEQSGVSLSLEKELSADLIITSITSWNTLEDDWGVGFSGGVEYPFFGEGYIELYGRDAYSDQDSYTQEIQLQGNAFDGFMSFVGGLYYFHEEGDQHIESSIYLADSYTDFTIDTDSYAAFGQASLHVSDDVSVIVGGRYTKENKSLDASLSGEAVVSDDDFSKFTPKLGVEYQVNKNLFMFASYTVGFKAGGYNGLASTSEALGTAFQMQEVSAYEFGVKSDLLDNRLRLNVATFFNDYTNLQQQSVTAEGAFITENYDAEHKGIEADMRVRLTSNLSLWANGVYQDSEYTDTAATGGESTGALLGNQMTNVFKFQYATGLDYMADIGPGTFAIGANVNRKADIFSTSDNAEIGHIPALTLVDAYASYAVDRWKLTLAGKNLTDEKYWYTGFGFDVVQPRFMADPMTWRLSLSYEM
ncbi:TonB-dependent receptor [Alteromonas sp. NFXS44]|uniref:TonB-dependent receptor n=1 Tax=Alteromonas sp. NFXS44 TaxID=2818435 RepID=UPI0032DFE8C9